MNITHLNHSGFLIEDGRFVILFDCIDQLDTKKIKEKEIIFFASHSHKDHFDPTIAEALSELHTTYILSYDIKERPSKDLTCIMKPKEKVTLGPLHVETYDSTDRGVSYLVKLNDYTYFHCGDLNWWHWKKMTPEQLLLEESDFKRVIDEIKDKSIDFAFVPVDPRLEEFGLLAAQYFLDTVKPKYLIPMHSFGDYAYYNDLDKKLQTDKTILLNCSHKNQKIYKEQ
ncbi:MBL fold metallo-hydrolase [Alkalibacter mobilis]|uniref:MBL fold metallo-hydrolase n=1 Tax=Alkalibacter mobilis TaxID=2787712 RepID=UPI00189E512D|nr:MBL fold metallo-hydrolase [Alkalibacter mobilis]MBF7096929.1 MBL fold metallo-hydrolase [Alkalibacter mobilis]